MSVPSLSRPSLAGWPSLASLPASIISSELPRSHSGPMYSSRTESTAVNSVSPTADDVDTANPSDQPGVTSDSMEIDEDVAPVEPNVQHAPQIDESAVIPDTELQTRVVQELADDVEMSATRDSYGDDDSEDYEDGEGEDSEDEAERDDEDEDILDVDHIKADDEDLKVPQQNGGPVAADVIQELFSDNDRLTRAVASQHSTIDELRKQLHEAIAQLAVTEKRLITVSQDLAASRSFVAKEDTDGQQILVVFKDVNEGVDDHTFLLLDAVTDPPEGATLDLPTARALLDSHDLIRSELSHFVFASLFQKMPLVDFSTFFIPALLNAILLRIVFRPFTPGLDAARSAHLQACYEDICRREPQDRSARWRSISYARACPSRDDASLVAEAVNLFYSALEASLPHIFLSDGEVILSLRKQFSGAAAKVVRDALKLQDLAMATYISFDYHIIAPPANSLIVPTHAKSVELLKHCPHSIPRTDPGEAGKVSLAVVAFGLLASKGTQRNQSSDVERVTTVMEKASVVAATCRWASSHTS